MNIFMQVRLVSNKVLLLTRPVKQYNIQIRYEYNDT